MASVHSVFFVGLLCVLLVLDACHGGSTTSTRVVSAGVPTTSAMCPSVDSESIQHDCVNCIPLPDLRSGTYEYDGVSRIGGLYSDGSNELPLEHHELLQGCAAEILPRNKRGNVVDNGVIGFIGLGSSHAAQSFAAFERNEDRNPVRNPRVVYINGAQGGIGLEKLANMNHRYWSLLRARVKATGLSLKQVQVGWIEAPLQNPCASGSRECDDSNVLGFASYVNELYGGYVSTVRNLKTFFPNLKVLYVSSQSYGGYSASLMTSEPLAYQAAYGVRKLLLQQINGNPNLNANPAAGNVVAPVLVWGPYLWGNAVHAREDGLAYCHYDYEEDGYNPSREGERKLADQMSTFFGLDATSQVVLTASSDSGNVVVVESAADAYVDSSMPDVNFGADDELNSTFVGTNEQIIYVKFRLQDIGDASNIVHAKLSLRLRDQTRGGGNVARVPSNAWQEETISYSNRPAISSEASATVPAITRDGTFAADVTGDVRQQAGKGLTLAIYHSAFDSAGYYSRETGDGPRLIIIRKE